MTNINSGTEMYLTSFGSLHLVEKKRINFRKIAKNIFGVYIQNFHMKLTEARDTSFVLEVRNCL